jgi:hypothetical protein
MLEWVSFASLDRLEAAKHSFFVFGSELDGRLLLAQHDNQLSSLGEPRPGDDLAFDDLCAGNPHGVENNTCCSGAARESQWCAGALYLIKPQVAAKL